jgi:hypothetical protein
MAEARTKGLGTRKINGKAWMQIDEPVRARLNRYKLLLGIADNGITDQTAAITALLDKVGAPGADETVRIIAVESTQQAVQP